MRDTGVPKNEGQHLQSVMPSADALGGPGEWVRQDEAHLTERDAEDGQAARVLEGWVSFWQGSGHVFVEKSPPNLMRTRLLRAIFPRSVFLIIVRNPLVVALSTQRRWASDSTVARQIENWLIANETLVADAAGWDDVAIVRYERFIADPSVVASEALRRVRLDPAPVDVSVVRTGMNEKYLADWPAHSEYEQGFDPDLVCRVHRFGYRLDDPTEIDEPDPSIAALFDLGI